MSEGITCYGQDERLCKDPVCQRTGCPIRNAHLTIPSSLNDACRTIETMADEIASLRAQLEGCKEMFAHTAERANEYVKAFQQQEGKLASARKALEMICDARNDPYGTARAGLLSLTDEEGK